MELIDRYVIEVGKHLPQKQRADLEKEIRSTLLDMLEERDPASSDAEREAAVIALLKEYGPPRKVAESYVGPRYLIGPRLYPTFELVVKIVMAVLLGIGLFGFIVGSVFDRSLVGPEFINLLGDFWSGVLSSMFSALGTIVIVFAILERVLPASEFEKEAQDWDPADLAREPDPDQIKLSESIATIIFTTIGLIVFNLFPNLIGFSFVTDGEWTHVSVLSDAFFTYLPWINLLGVLEIAFSLFQLQQRSWTTLMRLFKIGIEAGSLALAIVMLRGPSLLDMEALKSAGVSLAEAGKVLTRVMEFVPTIVLLIVIVVSTIEVAQMTYRLFRIKYQTLDLLQK